MAKKQSRQPKTDPARRATVLTVRGTDEWRDWLDRGAKHCRLTVSTLVDLAVAKYLKDHGFDESPPDR